MTRSDGSTVEQRLRTALNVDLDVFKDGVDMSAAAVTHRVREACEMSTLCLELVAAGANSQLGQ